MVQVQTRSLLEPHQWHHVLAMQDGSGKAAGVKLFVDGVPAEVVAPADSLDGSISNDQPLQIGNGQPGALFKGAIDEARVYNRVLSELEMARLPGLSIHSLLAIEPAQRGEVERRRAREHYLAHHAPDAWKNPFQVLAGLLAERVRLERNLPTVMVMQDQKSVRETRLLVRGAYDRCGEKVTARTPGFLPPMDQNLPRDRLGLARWLVDPGHPLTARVVVNHFWQQRFGTGLVRTAEDFGTQGEPPSHPELLDWVAGELVRSGWDVKAMQKLIVTSATYRQSSRATAELLEKDPENRLLARGPRPRLEAEVIRDQALAVSGLLSSTIGGPSVKPYQPEGLWTEVAFDTSGANLTAQVYVQDRGEKLYRRSLYTFWKRTAPPPTMLLFDAPDRERCTVRRNITSTPLQALVIQNDPTYVEASRKLAERMMTDGGSRPEDRIRHGFRLAATRWPTPLELGLLVDMFRRERGVFGQSPGEAGKLLAVGESPVDPARDPGELAAYTLVASAIFNLDEVLTRS